MCAYKAPSLDTLRALETAPSMFLILSPDLCILTASDSFLEATQTQRAHIKGQFIFDAFPDNPDFPESDGVKNINASLQLVLKTKRQHHMDIQRYDVPDHSNPGQFIYRYWDPSHTPILDEHGEISYIIQLANNVTDQVQMSMQLSESKVAEAESLTTVHDLDEKLNHANQELMELNISLERQVNEQTLEVKNSEEKYRSLIQHSPVAMQVFRGEDMTFEIVNDAMLKFLGKTSEIIGKPLFEGVPEIVGQPIVDVLYGVYRNGNSLELLAEKVLLERDGQVEAGYYDVMYRPLYDSGIITGVLGIAIDVTQQEQAKLAIQESEVRFRTMAEGSGIFIGTIGVNGEIDYLNKAWIDFIGRKLANLDRSFWDDLVHSEDLEAISGIYYGALKEQQPFSLEFRLRNAKGHYRWVRLNGAPRVDAGNTFQGFICSGVDFTEEKEQLLKIAHINIELVKANEQLESTIEKLRLSEENLQSAFNAADLGSCSLNLKTGSAEMSPRYRSLYGLPLVGEITWDMVMKAVEPEFHLEVNTVMENAMKYGTPVDSTYAIRHLETGVRHWMRVAGKVRRDEEGNFSHVYAVVMDVTVQKQDEQRKNDFIAMVSHELKTPLTSVTGYAQVLKRMSRNTNDTLTVSILDKMELQVKKMSAMINGFLNISRLEAGKIQMEVHQFDIEQLIAEIGEEFRTTTSNREILYDSTGPLFVIADKDKIGHVINNLISNAIKYSDSSSQINIKCKVVADQVVFSIQDQGIGVNSEDLPRLFDRYYRVHGTQTTNVSGFGIGLYLSAEIVERHGGKIWAESEMGVGSTFYFSLPLI
jgi:two-component system sensor histidine kinase VicK